MAVVPTIAVCAQQADIVTGEAVAESGVQVFTPDFYAEYRPETALDLVFRTPGFRLDTGDNGRGLAGVEGNILINGERPPPRGTSIFNRLSSIRFEDVVRVELIEAGARDVDMQGYPILLNLVTLPQTTRRTAGQFWVTQREDGTNSFNLNLSGTINGERHEAQATLQASNSLNNRLDSLYSP